MFQFWAYAVGMGRLLLRSIKTPSFASRIDVVFQNVQAVKLPTVLHGLAISRAEKHEIEIISAQTGLQPDEARSFFILSGSHYDGYIVAGVMTICEDHGEYFEPSEIWPD
jgi:hypothetical protein